MRPSSSLGVSHRAPSRQSQPRPASSLSHGAPFRSTPRPNQPSHSRFDAKLAKLVTQITGLTLEEHPAGFTKVIQSSKKITLDLKYAGVAVTIEDVDQAIHGILEKALINLKYDFAEALTLTHQRLKTAVAETQDQEDRLIKASLLPEHIHFLLSLSRAPEPSTYTYASLVLDKINNPQKDSQLTWAQILAEDPFEGEHWEGAYGLPPGAFKSERRASTPSTDSAEWSQLEDQRSPVLSGRSSPSLASPILTSLELGRAALTPYEGSDMAISTKNMIEELQHRQYWSKPRRLDFQSSQVFDPHDPSTFGLAVARALQIPGSLSLPEDEFYMREVDAVREVLLLLRGSDSTLFERSSNPATRLPYLRVKERIPRLMHLSLSSYISLLSSFASNGTALLSLKESVARVFSMSVFKFTSNPNSGPAVGTNNKALEAYAEAVESLIHQFEHWIAEKEQAICQAQNSTAQSETVITLLNLQCDVQTRMASTFDVLLDIIRDLEDDKTIPNLTTSSGAALSAFLLDSLLSRVQSHIFIDNNQTAYSLAWVFLRTCQPIWTMAGQWLKDGAHLEQTTDLQYNNPCSSTEFFLQRTGVSIGLPEFWQDGYEVKQPFMVPRFLKNVAAEILSVGKAVGLIRGLGLDSFFHDDGNTWMSDWPSFAELIGLGLNLDKNGVTGSLNSDLPRVSIESLEAAILEYLSPFFRIAHNRLNRILVDECHLWQHLESIEDLLLMGRGDTISYFADMIFTKIEARQMWRDYHFLNTAFREAIEASQCHWINTSLIRISYRTVKSQDALRTVRAFEGLTLEYQTPFPLTYLFGPASMQVYSSIFVFLMQIRRAKNVLDKLVVKGAIPASIQKTADELKAFYVMRGKLSWFINMLLNFVMTNVLHVKVLRLHAALKKATSLDDMIQIHHHHLERLETQCFMRLSDANLRQTITSILDLVLTFGDIFYAFTGDTSIDISRSSLIILRQSGRGRSRPRRSRFKRRQQRNYVSFVEDLPPESSDDDESSDEDMVPSPLLDPEDAALERLEASTSFSEETFIARLKSMELRLDEYVRFIRRSVDILAAESTSEDDAVVFGILAFALEDWDL